MEVGLAQAKNNLPRLIKAVLGGEQVIIVNRGKPVAEIVRSKPKVAKVRFGTMPGLTASFPSGWDSPRADQEIAALFEELN